MARENRCYFEIAYAQISFPLRQSVSYDTNEVIPFSHSFM